MTLDIFISFNGDCREAVGFYAKVFGLKTPEMMTYGDAPADSFDEAIPGEAKPLICYTCLPIGPNRPMFCDAFPGMPVNVGNNMAMTVGSGDADEIRRLFAELSEGGSVDMELQKTFWSGLFGMVTDKFGICWQLSHSAGA